jgi:hypothetical protein
MFWAEYDILKTSLSHQRIFIMVSPYSPAQAKEERAQTTPAEVITVINELLAQRSENHRISITQEEVVETLITRFEIPRENIFLNHMLNIESAYRANGWNVEYDKPSWNESYKAYWVFSQK